jgi:hypothetical protein|tara:strand:+ start:16307 stop:17110 length:804 start_codon:yes stop_codon:yes gene_type:complete
VTARAVHCVGRSAVAATVLAAVLAVPSTAHAQAPETRWFIALDGGFQTTAVAEALSEPITFEQSAEEGELTRDVTINRRPTIALAGGVRLWRQAGLRVGFQRFTRSDDLALGASIPHPFFFDAPRIFSDSSTMTRHERSLDLHGYWSVPVGDRFNVRIFGGPTVYFAALDLPGVDTAPEEYPYEEVPITGIVKVERNPTALGWGAGADLSFFFSRHVGVGWTARFSDATAEISLPDEGFLAETVGVPVVSEVGLGGAQIAAGIRVRF